MYNKNILIKKSFIITVASLIDIDSDSSCRDSSPLRDVFPVRLPAAAAAAPSADSADKDGEEKQNSDRCQVTMICSEDAGTQIIQHQDSLTDYCSISSCGTQEAPGSPESATFDSIAPPPADPQGERSVPDRQQSEEAESTRGSAGIPSPPPLQLQAFTVLPVNGTLWIPR